MAAEAGSILVTVARTEGSVPREVGAWMRVNVEAVQGTVGGGHLEFDAIAKARAALGGAPLPDELRYALGPSLGQCCGGVVWLRFERLAAGEDPAARIAPQRLRPLALFGAGHVGRAIAKAAVDLPLALHWLDSRDEMFDGAWSGPLPPGWRLEVSEPAEAAVAALAPGSVVLIMTHNHAEDFEVLAACLRRQRQQQDLTFIGMIGSATKWASFRQRLEARGFSGAERARVCCPIGVPGVQGKQPAIIAVAVLAQILALPCWVPSPA